jgi:hypothetical protein
VVDFFQTCADDQAGCVDDRKENNFSLRPFLPELWPFVNLSNTILWHQLLINYQADFFQSCTDDQAQSCTDDQAGCADDRKENNFSLRPFLPELWPFVNFSTRILCHQLLIYYLVDFSNLHR